LRGGRYGRSQAALNAVRNVRRNGQRGCEKGKAKVNGVDKHARQGRGAPPSAATARWRANAKARERNLSPVNKIWFIVVDIPSQPRALRPASFA